MRKGFQVCQDIASLNSSVSSRIRIVKPWLLRQTGFVCDGGFLITLDILRINSGYGESFLVSYLSFKLGKFRVASMKGVKLTAVSL